VRRFFSFLVGNWPLKLGAIALATALYGGVVVSENARTWPGQVPIEVLNPPLKAAVLDVLGDVTGIRYRAPLEVASQLTNGSFKASVDLSNAVAQPGGAPVDVAVNVIAVDRRVTIIDYSPPTVRVRIDTLATRAFPVLVDFGLVPDGFSVDAPQITPDSVTVTGASSRVAGIHSITGRVTIDASGINVNQEAALVALDEQGNEVPGLQIEPARVRVRISVARDLANATLPVIPTLIGIPATSYEVKTVTVDPLTVEVGGETAIVTRLPGLNTVPIDVSGRNDSFVSQVAVVAPAGITIDGQATVRVSITIGVSTASRTYEVGLEPTPGGRPDFLYHLSLPSVLVRLSGPATTLDALDIAQLHALIPVDALDVGSHTVDVTFVAPPDTKLELVTPSSVDVLVSVVPGRSPSPSSSESPSGSPPAPSPSP
jgi:YbbR domain-containing protein